MSATVTSTKALLGVPAALERAIEQDKLDEALRMLEQSLRIYRGVSPPEEGYEVDAAGTFIG